MTSNNIELPDWTDVMVDLETTGTRPDRAAILQIGAVRFNLARQTVHGEDMFNRSLDIPPHRGWDESTREWWLNQKAGVLDDIMSRAEPHADVMSGFRDWSIKYPNLRFWAKPITFDFMFMSSYFHDHGYINPYHYRVARDVNSFVEALHYPAPIPEVERSDFGDAHNALNDALYQIEYLFNHCEVARKRD